MNTPYEIYNHYHALADVVKFDGIAFDLYKSYEGKKGQICRNPQSWVFRCVKIGTIESGFKTRKQAIQGAVKAITEWFTEETLKEKKQEIRRQVDNVKHLYPGMVAVLVEYTAPKHMSGRFGFHFDKPGVAVGQEIHNEDGTKATIIELKLTEKKGA